MSGSTRELSATSEKYHRTSYGPTRPKTDPAYAEAQRRIAACQAQRSRRLDLSGLGLTALPPEIGQLTELTELYLWLNVLTALPPEIGQLTKLTSSTFGQLAHRAAAGDRPARRG